VIKPAPGKRRCKCRNEIRQREIAPGMFLQISEQEILFCEDGEPEIDGEPGDLKFKIQTTRHKRFRREGSDLHATTTISLLESLVDFKKNFCHLDNHLVSGPRGSPSRNRSGSSKARACHCTRAPRKETSTSLSMWSSLKA